MHRIKNLIKDTFSSILIAEMKPKQKELVANAKDKLKTNYHTLLWKKRSDNFSKFDTQRGTLNSLFSEAETKTDKPQSTNYEDNVGIDAYAKSFKLTLNEFGPYRIDYSKEGKSLLLTGATGHVAVMDWKTKRLSCEMNVMEKMVAGTFLNDQNTYALSGRNSVQIYNTVCVYFVLF